MDHKVHNVLKSWGKYPSKSKDNKQSEWYRCGTEDVKRAVAAVKLRNLDLKLRGATFLPRPEQKAAVDKTFAYFNRIQKEKENSILPKSFVPKFLWNCKMRFGKTFASYLLAQKMECKRVLVLTFKPAVQTAWQEDIQNHVYFDGWQFVTRGGMAYEDCDKDKPIVCFGSFQDFLGTNENGGIKARNEWVHTTYWDMVIFDEYHFGAWRENARKLFEAEDQENLNSFDAEKYNKEEAVNAQSDDSLPISAKRYLFLSGTPFRALNSGEFIEEEIDKDMPNPYEVLPRMVMMTYQIPDSIKEIARGGEFNEFDLNVFFSADGTGKDAQFKFKEHVQKWLDLIRGAYLPSTMDDMKLGANKKPPMPFSDTRLLNVLSHTVWLLPGVSSCFAMANLLKEKQNAFFHDYKVIVCAGTQAGIGAEALIPVQDKMDNPLESKTITLSCGKLMTGVTVKPWTGIFMLCNLLL